MLLDLCYDGHITFLFILQSEDTVGPCNLPFSDFEDESLNTDADVSFPKCVSRDMTINTYGRVLSIYVYNKQALFFEWQN